MSELLQIQGQLEKVGRQVADLERALVDFPGHPSIAANLASAVRVQEKLQMQFTEAAANLGVEVCRYRSFDEHGKENAGASFGAISEFQRLVAVIFGAKKYGKKQRAVVDRGLEKETAFGFGFAFTGSIGVVLTIRSDADMFGDSYLDETMQAIFSMASTSDPAEIQQFADALGPGAINALYHWATANSEHGLGADIEWRRGAELRGSLFIQRQELSKLRLAIEQTSSEKEDTITIDGTLTGAVVSNRTFRIKREGLPEIRGTFELGAINAEHEVKLPHRYKATVRRTTRLFYATGKKEVRYHLMHLAEIKKEGGRNVTEGTQ